MKKIRRRTLAALCIAVMLLSGCGMEDVPFLSQGGKEEAKNAVEGLVQDYLPDFVSGSGTEDYREPDAGSEPEIAGEQDTGSGPENAGEPEIAGGPDVEYKEEPTPIPRDENSEYVENFWMTLVDGTEVCFDDYRGKKIIINFWATWCGPCVGEMPAFQRLTDNYPDEVIVLAINCSEDQRTVEQFVKQMGYTFPVALDDNYTLQMLFGGFNSIPTTFIIDEEGYIITSHTGASDADSMYELYRKDLGL